MTEVLAVFRRKLSGSTALATAGIGLVLTGLGGVALADSLFIRDRNISVLERERPGYEAEGIRAGQFIVKPKVDVGFGYSSNVFAISDVDASLGFDSFEDESDIFVFVRPSIRAESDWGRHAIAAGAYVESARFNEFDTETVTDGGFYVDGQYDLPRSAALFGGLSYDVLNESRRNYNSSFLFEEPVDYTVGRIYGGLRQELGRIRYMGQLDYAERDYDDVESVVRAVTPGLFIRDDQDFRDRNTITALGEVAFAVTRDTAIYFNVEGNWQDFDGRDPVFQRERDSQGYRVTTGAEFDISKLVRGRLGIGYFNQQFDDANFAEIDGTAIEAALEWFPSDLTTVSLTANRGIDQSAIFSSSGYVSSDITLRIDHELRRNLILSSFLAYGLDEYDDPLLDSTGAPILDGNGNALSQEIDRFGAGVSADYYFNRNLAVALDYTYETQDVTQDVFVGGFDTNFDVHQMLVTFTLQR